eukprot:3222746-Rhodomonas_salina.1
MVKLLLEKGASVDKATDTDYTPLMTAAENGHQEVVEALLAAGANVNAVAKSSNTPLKLAAACGFPDIVSMLLKAGADKDFKTKWGTALQSSKKNVFDEETKTTIAKMLK